MKTTPLQKQTRAALSRQIKEARTRQELETLEATVTRHYNAGTITATGLAFLDSMIMARVAKLDPIPQIIGYAVQCGGLFLAVQGGTYWFQDTPDGWALYSSEEGAESDRKAHCRPIAHRDIDGGQVIPVEKNCTYS